MNLSASIRVAVASSGLGHVARGVETWACDTACALAEAGLDVTLFAAGKVAVRFGPAASGLTILPCIRRTSRAARRLARLVPTFCWRWGLTSPYGIEQLTFWLRLWRRLRTGAFDILHVQDPRLAYWCRKFRALGLLRTKEILGHGTEESIDFLKQFDYVQHLAPWHLEQALQLLGARRELRRDLASPTPSPDDSHPVPSFHVAPRNAGQVAIWRRSRRRSQFPVSSPRPHWVVIPNFVDTSVFCPAPGSTTLRAQLEIPEEAFVIGTAAAVKKTHKRIDYLIREFAAFLADTDPAFRVQQQASESSRLPPVASPKSGPPAYLLIAGARQEETDELVAMAEGVGRGRIRILLDLPREEMPAFYRSLSMFVLASLFEMMPIAVLEAMASGLPVVTHRHPVLEWMVGAGGAQVDMREYGSLTGFLLRLDPQWLRRHGSGARARVEVGLAKDRVIGECIRYYKQILGKEAGTRTD